MGVVGTAWLVDAVTGAPSYTGRLNRQNTSVFLASASSARPFGAVSGVRPGTSTSTVTATSTTWTAQTFAGVIDLQASALSGAYGFAFNLVTSGSVTASNATNPRIDILSVRIDDPAEGDGTSVPAVTMVYTAGTAAGSPVAPATPARSFIIATLQFPAGTGTTPTVTWVAPYVVAAGGIQPVPSSATYPASPFVGQQVDDAALGYTLRWSGTAWVPVGSGAVIPTATSTGSIGSDGKVTFTAAATVAVDVSAFSDDEYEFILDVTSTSATTVPTVQLRAASANLTGAVYDYQNLIGSASSATASAITAATAWQPAFTGTVIYSRITLSGLGQTRAKIGTHTSYSTQNPQTAPSVFTAGLQYRNTTVVTGIAYIFTGGTATGTLRIRRKNV